MGYHVPSAENVYQYICRADRHSANSLSDGFSWSILFVNDNSSTCREFLREFGLELCHRTADRIRFVFFSGLEVNETVGLLEGVSFRGEAPFLSRIIKAATQRIFPKRKYDWERDPWKRFRPEELYALDSHEKISRHINAECEIHTAMPGSEEAFKLAQRLGIGRFVPCFLFFSDVGKPVVYLLPVAQQTPTQLYARLRGLIDSFYEINHSILTQWKKIEDEISATCWNFQTSIYKVSSWKNEQEQPWQELQLIANYVIKLADSDHAIEVLKEIRNDWHLSSELRDLTNSCLNKLQSFEEIQRSANDAKIWIDALVESLEAKFNLNYFSKFPQNKNRIPNTIANILEESAKLFKSTTYPIPIEEKLIKWWRSENGKPITRGQYNRYRTAWVDYSKAKYGETAVGNIAQILKNEFKIVLDTSMSQPIAITTELAANEVISNLALHFNVPPDDSEWNNCVSDFRSALTEYFSNLKSSLPVEVTDFNSKLTLNLCWRDCIPAFEQRQKYGLNHSIEQLPHLNKVIQDLNFERELNLRDIEKKYNLEKQRIVEKLSTAINQWLSSLVFIEVDKQSVQSTLISALFAFRQALENKVFENLKKFLQLLIPVKSFLKTMQLIYFNCLKSMKSQRPQSYFHLKEILKY